MTKTLATQLTVIATPLQDACALGYYLGTRHDGDESRIPTAQRFMEAYGLASLDTQKELREAFTTAYLARRKMIVPLATDTANLKRFRDRVAKAWRDLKDLAAHGKTNASRKPRTAGDTAAPKSGAMPSVVAQANSEATGEEQPAHKTYQGALAQATRYALHSVQNLATIGRGNPAIMKSVHVLERAMFIITTPDMHGAALVKALAALNLEATK